MSPAANPLSSVTAAELCRRGAILQEHNRQLATPDRTALQFVTLLWRQNERADAIRGLAYLLPLPRTVWWGCICVRLLPAARWGPLEEAALAAAVHWVLEPTAEHQQAAWTAGMQVKRTPAGALALAAGDPYPPDSTPWPPASLAADGILAAAGHAGSPAEVPDFQDDFLIVGAGVASGKHLWPGARS